MSEQQPDVRPEDAVQIAQRALAKVNELERDLEDLRDEHEDAVENLAALQLRVSEQDEDRDYESLTLDEKIGMVREHGFQKAADGHGKTTLTYHDIMWEVFDGQPGNNHCYKLIRLAAGLDDGCETGSEISGFTARDPDDGTYHLAVDAESAKQSRAFYSRNKAAAEGGR